VTLSAFRPVDTSTDQLKNLPARVDRNYAAPETHSLKEENLPAKKTDVSRQNSTITTKMPFLNAHLALTEKIQQRQNDHNEFQHFEQWAKNSENVFKKVLVSVKDVESESEAHLSSLTSLFDYRQSQRVAASISGFNLNFSPQARQDLQQLKKINSFRALEKINHTDPSLDIISRNAGKMKMPELESPQITGQQALSIFFSRIILQAQRNPVSFYTHKTAHLDLAG
jgi:hypothetical protein